MQWIKCIQIKIWRQRIILGHLNEKNNTKKSMIQEVYLKVVTAWKSVKVKMNGTRTRQEYIKQKYKNASNPLKIKRRSVQIRESLWNPYKIKSILPQKE
jgi:hypothetical protein